MTRDPYYDNAKFLIIWMVVVAHGMELFAASNGASNGLHKMIMAFATPAFAFLSGVFSRADLTTGEALKAGSRILVPYFAFQVIFNALDHLYNGYPLVSYSIFDPYWGLWYVLALFVWRLLLPLISASRFPLILSIVIGLAAGFLPANNALVVNPRAFVFLPFFVAGHLVGRDRERLKRLTVLPLRIAAAVCLPGLAALFILFHELIDWRWLLPRSNAVQLGLSGGEWLAIRAGAYGATLILGACAFSLVPKRRTFFTALGVGTFYVYLLHIPLIRWATFAGLAAAVRSFLASEALEVAAVFAAAAVVTLVLSQKPVRVAFRFLVEPSPRAVSVGAPLLIALAVGLAFIPSLNHWGADVVRLQDIAPSVARSASLPPIEIGPAGLIVKLGRKRTERKATLRIDCTATYTVTLFDGRFFVGTAEFTADESTSRAELELPIAGRKKYDTLVLEPWNDMPCGASSRLSTLRFH